MKFEKESELCAAYRDIAETAGWTVYAETGGWDMLLVHKSGAQVGVEAKKSVTAKALLQCLRRGPRSSGYSPEEQPSPDFFAVLAARCSEEMRRIAQELGVTIITMKSTANGYRLSSDLSADKFREATPGLPRFKRPNRSSVGAAEDWVDLCPTKRVELPDYVPDVQAGVASPVQLSDWKVRAIRACIWVERNGRIEAQHFRALSMSISRWIQMQWIVPTGQRGVWKPTALFPAEKFKAQHPDVWRQIEKDFDVWGARLGALQPVLPLSGVGHAT